MHITTISLCLLGQPSLNGVEAHGQDLDSSLERGDLARNRRRRVIGSGTDEHALPGPAYDEAVGSQRGDRASDGPEGDREPRGELRVRVELRPLLDRTGLDLVAENPSDLEVRRPRVIRVERRHPLTVRQINSVGPVSQC